MQQAGDVYLGDNVGVVWVTFDKRTGTAGNATQTIYVGVADKANPIYRSTNGGSTWAPVPFQPTGFLAHHGVLAPNGILYVSYSDWAGPYDGGKGDVWKFDTATGIWTMISPVPSSSADDYFGYGGLAVDARAPNTIMVAALNSWWPDTIIFRSTNGGATWTRIWDWGGSGRTFRYVQDISAAPWLTFNANPPPPEITPKLGWMVGDLEIDPFNSNRMMYGTGATIYGSDDLTAWDSGGQIHITVKAQGIEETAVLDLISPPSGAPLISGLGDVCGFRHNSLTTSPAVMMGSPTFISTTSLDYAELTPNFIVRVGNANTGCDEFRLLLRRWDQLVPGKRPARRCERRRHGSRKCKRHPRCLESLGHRCAFFNEQRQQLDSFDWYSGRSESRFRPCGSDEILWFLEWDLLCKHERRGELQFFRSDRASELRQVQSRSRPKR